MSVHDDRVKSSQYILEMPNEQAIYDKNLNL